MRHDLTWTRQVDQLRSAIKQVYLEAKIEGLVPFIPLIYNMESGVRNAENAMEPIEMTEYH